MTAPSPAQLLADRGFSAFEPLEQPDENYPTIMIDPDRTFQTIEGFGGAFTDAAADVFAQLPTASQEQFLEACFDPVDGNGYTCAGRRSTAATTPPGCTPTPRCRATRSSSTSRSSTTARTGCPSSSAPRPRPRASCVSTPRRGARPAWMKTNDEMKHGGKLKPEYRQTWADYFVKYVKAYAAEGVPMWGLTVQNEALATQVWESCLFTANEERDFVRDYLGPTLHRHGLGDVKLMIWDHNRGLVYQRARGRLQRPAGRRSTSGAPPSTGTSATTTTTCACSTTPSPTRGCSSPRASVRGTWEAAVPPRPERHPGPQQLDGGLDRLEPAARPRGRSAPRRRPDGRHDRQCRHARPGS